MGTRCTWIGLLFKQWTISELWMLLSSFFGRQVSIFSNVYTEKSSNFQFMPINLLHIIPLLARKKIKHCIISLAGADWEYCLVLSKVLDSYDFSVCETSNNGSWWRVKLTLYWIAYLWWPQQDLAPKIISLSSDRLMSCLRLGKNHRTCI